MTFSKNSAVFLTLAFLVLGTAADAMAQIKVKRGAVVLLGSVANCSAPATVNYKKVQKATPQWKTIRSEGVRKGSARYQLLTGEMKKAIRKAVSSAAAAESCDCVVRSGDIKDDKGLTVKDLTQAVIDEL